MRRLPFLDRSDELRRLRRFLGAREGGLAVVYGRRRLGKSRLVSEALPAKRSVYYVADDRQASLQRAALAEEIARLVPGFSAVIYPGWDELLRRFWAEAYWPSTSSRRSWRRRQSCLASSRSRWTPRTVGEFAWSSRGRLSG